jgi:hypothetical protein
VISCMSIFFDGNDITTCTYDLKSERFPHKAGLDPDVAIPETRHNHAKSAVCRNRLINLPALIDHKPSF